MRSNRYAEQEIDTRCAKCKANVESEEEEKKKSTNQSSSQEEQE